MDNRADRFKTVTPVDPPLDELRDALLDQIDRARENVELLGSNLDDVALKVGEGCVSKEAATSLAEELACFTEAALEVHCSVDSACGKAQDIAERAAE